MHRQLLIILLFPLTIIAQEIDPTVVELREIISKIVDVQTTESEEHLSWEEQKATMSALLNLHKRELELLTRELEKSGKSAPGHAVSTENLKAEIETLKISRRVMSETIARTAPRTIALAKRFPAPLFKDCEAELTSLDSWKTATEPREILQAELSILGKADQFNRRLTQVTEARGNREVEVVYLGLATAFYAGNGNISGTGSPGPNGWIWSEQNEIYSEVSKLFDTLDKKRPPSMVTLPLKID